MSKSPRTIVDRFFLPRPIVYPESYFLESQIGFPLEDDVLVDLETTIFGRFRQSTAKEIRRWDDIDSLRCVVILAPPGWGKSTECRHQVERINAGADSNRRAFWIHLPIISSSTQLESALREVREHLNADAVNSAHVFFDSVDQCVLAWPGLSTSLKAELLLLIDRNVQFRFTCRPADWPMAIERYLEDLFGPPCATLPTHNDSSTPVAPDVGAAQLENDCDLIPSQYTGATRSKLQVDAPKSAPASWAIVRLCPLRKRDIETIATSHGIDDFGALCAALDRAEGWPFAADPMMLNAVIGSYRRGGISESRVGLYDQMINRILTEPNEEYTDTGRFANNQHHQRFSVDQRLKRAIAERLAALSLFGRRRLIRPNEMESIDGVLGRPDIDGTVVIRGDGGSSENPKTVSIDDISAVLDTGLFESAGPNSFAFAHQSFAEYLAACAICDWSPRQIRSLLAHPDDPLRRIVPQLREVAAWLAGMNPVVRDEFLERGEIAALLSVDPKSLTPVVRAAIAKRVFEQLGQPGQDDIDIDSDRAVNRLACPETTAIIRPFLLENGTEGQRFEAFHLAMRGCADVIMNEIADTALDPSQSTKWRSWSIGVLETRCTDQEILQRFEPLATGIPTGHEESQLKCHALMALYPKCWSGERLVESLFPLSRHPWGNLGNQDYSFFLKYELPSRIRDVDLPVVGSWLVSALTADGPDAAIDYGRLPAVLFFKLWQQSDSGRHRLIAVNLLRALERNQLRVWDHARGVFRWEPDLQSEFNAEWRDRPERRRAFLLTFLLAAGDPVFQDSSQIQQALFRNLIPTAIDNLIFDQNDLEWMLSIIGGLPSIGRAIVYNFLFHSLSDYPGSSPSLISGFIEAINADPQVMTFKEQYVDPWPLECYEAISFRKQAKRMKDREARLAASTPAPLWDRIEKLCGPAADGDCIAIAGIARQLCYCEVYEGDWGEAPFALDRIAIGWNSLDESRQSTVLQSLASGFAIGSPPNLELLRLPPPSWHGWAFNWLLYKSPDDAAIDAHTWERWLPWAISTANQHGLTEFIEVIWTQEPKAATKFVALAVRGWLEGVTASHPDNPRLLPGVSDGSLDTTPAPPGQIHPPVGDTIAEKCRSAIVEIAIEYLGEKPLPLGAEQWLLRVAFRLPPPALTAWLKANIQIKKVALCETPEHDRHTFRLRCLASQSPNDAWKILIDVKQIAPETAIKMLIDSHSCLEPITRLGNMLDEATLESMVSCLLPIVYGTAQSPSIMGTHSTGSLLLNLALTQLQIRGTREAVDATYRLAQSINTCSEILIRTHRAAHERWLRTSWRGNQPGDLNHILVHRKARTIASEIELHQIACDLLDEVVKIQNGNATLAPLLWSGKQPLDELSLQCVIKNQMSLLIRDWGFSYDCGVEIGSNGKSDFQVSAKTTSGHRVVVQGEIKREMHPDVETAMENQLVNGYMKNADCHCGIYVVGRYRGRVKGRRKIISAKEMRCVFEAQAQQVAAIYPNQVYQLTAFVIDCGLPEAPSKTAKLANRKAKSTKTRTSKKTSYPKPKPGAPRKKSRRREV